MQLYSVGDVGSEDRGGGGEEDGGAGEGREKLAGVYR